jgi:hypothetical protein
VLARSARLLREAEDLGGDDPWQEERRRGASQRTSVLVFVTLLTIVSFGVFVGNPADPAYSSDNRLDGRPAPIGSTIGRLIGRRERLSLGDGLESGGLGMWRDLNNGSAWTPEGAYVRPGRLRIWSPSESMANYDFEFVGQIDRKSLDWAFRAVDSKNYYASKVAILTPETTAIVRYVVLNGVVSDRTELPLPLNLLANRDYHFRMTAQGSRFRTFIDGRIVSSWNDARISRGGIGFFSEDGERSLLKWAALTERDSLAGRVLCHFSALLFPAPPLVEASHLEANPAMLGW